MTTICFSVVSAFHMDLILQHKDVMTLPVIEPLIEIPCGASMERRFQDGGGCIWRVYERIDGDYPALVFENMPTANMPVTRRVQHFPANWCTLSAGELTTLSWEH